TIAAVTMPPTAVIPITARTADWTVNTPNSSGPRTPQITPAITQPSRVKPAVAHGKSRAHRRVSAEPGSPLNIGAAHRVPSRTPTAVSAVNAATEKTISTQVTAGPEVTGSMSRK